MKYVCIGILPISQSHINNCNIADAAAFKGRSFKVGWGKNMTLLCLSTYNNIETDRSSTDSVLYSPNPCTSTIMQCVCVKKLDNFTSSTFEVYYILVFLLTTFANSSIFF